MITEGSDITIEEERARKVSEVLGPKYGTRAQTALRYALANSDLSCVVIGLAELSHLEEALAGADMGPLPAEAVARLQTLYDSSFGTS